MPHPYPVDAAVTAGMKRDFNRAQMPGASAWNLIDLIPDELGAPLGDVVVGRMPGML